MEPTDAATENYERERERDIIEIYIYIYVYVYIYIYICGSPSSARLPIFFGGGRVPSSKIDYRKKGYPYSNLSTGGPRYSFSYVYLCMNHLLSSK